MNLHTAWLVLAVAVPAQATEFTVAETSAIDLQTMSATRAPDADVLFSPGLIRARFGLRAAEEEGAAFQTSRPLVIREVLIVRDADHVEYLLRVSGVAGGFRTVEVQLEAPWAGPGAIPLSGVFRTTEVRVNGALGIPTGPPLRLWADGRYRLGGVNGRWTYAGSEHLRVVLDGYYAAWGQAVLSANRKSLTFRFARGPTRFEQVMTLEELTMAAR